MKTQTNLIRCLTCFSTVSLGLLLLAGCQSAPDKSAGPPAPVAASAPAAAAPAPAPTPVPVADNQQQFTPIHINAGGDGFKDNSGNVWLADQGFTEGDTVERPELTITNTTTPHIYQSEHYSMTRFTQPLPNGKYIVKLHFCETFEGITGPGERVFSFNVAGHEFKNFDVWVKAGGPQRAYVESVPVEITNGKLEITFTPNVENPQINGIEIYPAS